MLVAGGDRSGFFFCGISGRGGGGRELLMLLDVLTVLISCPGGGKQFLEHQYVEWLSWPRGSTGLQYSLLNQLF